jgi:tetratricopeptide (TPR) repeat protein
MLGGLAEAQGKTEAAKGFYAKAVELDATLEEGHLGLGLLAEREKKEGAAAAYYEKGLKRLPDSARLRARLACLYGKYALGRRKGLQLAQEAHELRPTDGVVLDALGWLSLLNERPQQAQIYLRLAAEAVPHDAEVWFHLGKAQAEAGQAPDAVRSFEVALLLAPDGDFAKEARKFVAAHR